MKETKIRIGSRTVTFFRPVAGSNKNKFNRVLKLARMFNQLDEKLCNFIERGDFISDHARCALATRIMMHTGIRVGNESSAEGYMTKPHPYSKEKPKFVKTYGLTTLEKRHFRLSRDYDEIEIFFSGKKQVDNSFLIQKKDLASATEMLVKNAPDDGTVFGISAYDLTKFIRKYVGRQFSPKDFRTLRANIEAWSMLNVISRRAQPTTKRDFNEEVKEIAGHVSQCLSNTPGVCKKSYIDDFLFKYHEQNRKP